LFIFAKELDKMDNLDEIRREANEKEAKGKNKRFSFSDGRVVYLKNKANDAELFLVGTSHVSQLSIEEVKYVIQKVKPTYVMVELDEKRYNDMMQPLRKNDDVDAFVKKIVGILTHGNISSVRKLMMIHHLVSHCLFTSIGLQSGQEMKLAVEEGKKVGANIVFGDQDINITMEHLLEEMSIYDALHFYLPKIYFCIEQMLSNFYVPDKKLVQKFHLLVDRRKLRQSNEATGMVAPTYLKVILKERDEVMTKVLWNLSGKVVGVVGLNHLDGIEQLWHEANEAPASIGNLA